jgi:tetratricopeptide (TPR) repeat protein
LAFHKQGYAQRKLGDYPEAVRLYTLAIELNPEYHQVSEKYHLKPI